MTAYYSVMLAATDLASQKLVFQKEKKKKKKKFTEFTELNEPFL